MPVSPPEMPVSILAAGEADSVTVRVDGVAVRPPLGSHVPTVLLVEHGKVLELTIGELPSRVLIARMGEAYTADVRTTWGALVGAVRIDGAYDPCPPEGE